MTPSAFVFPLLVPITDLQSQQNTEHNQRDLAEGVGQIGSYLTWEDASLGALAEWKKGAAEFAEDKEHGDELREKRSEHRIFKPLINA